MMEQKITEVVAALIVKDHRFLICQRPAHKARGMLWEFVGGKVEQGETLPQALIRECLEELGIRVTPQEIFMQLVHTYPDITVPPDPFLGTDTGYPAAPGAQRPALDRRR